MSDTPKQSKTLTLGKTLELKKSPGESNDQVRQSFSHGRSKTVAVEVKRRRTTDKADGGEQPSTDAQNEILLTQDETAHLSRFTKDELESRLRAVKQALREPPQKTPATDKQNDSVKAEETTPQDHAKPDNTEQTTQTEAPLEPPLAPVETKTEERPTPSYSKDKRNDWKSTERRGSYERPQQRPAATASGPSSTETRIFKASGYGTPVNKPKDSVKPQDRDRKSSDVASPILPDFLPSKTSTHHSAQVTHRDVDDSSEEASRKKTLGKATTPEKRTPSTNRDAFTSRKLTGSALNRALNDEEIGRTRSMAAARRAMKKHRSFDTPQETVKVVRDVTIPETITVGELANRMAERGADVVKTLMRLGMMVTINQVIDADTAELVCGEFGHTPIRVSDADVEIGLRGEEDAAKDLTPRAPVVTVMGHVDHGKTSLLDALRETDVVGGEAGGITQHIGAYQVTVKSGKKITFIDTPGHAAFTEMRARGANLTDVVVLVVAADDGIMPQTIEAINHAKAANVPLVVAINKIDKPEANSQRVRNDLLQHGVVLEDFGGEVLAIEVSAKKKMNLDKLEEAILLQAEVLELRANPNRTAEAVVIESKVDRGRGMVATVLVQRGTLRIGDIFVAGKEWGRVRAIVNDHGQRINEATPAMPVEVIGLNGLPVAGDELVVVTDEAKAREIAEYRDRKEREAKSAASAKSNMEKMLSNIAAGNMKELAVVIKTDVQGSLEALTSSLMKLATSEVTVRVLHGSVGGINESDVTLARASNGFIIGFNVRANPQARDLARRDNVDIRYYSIIYNVIDDVKAALGGLLSPDLKENFLGYAQIREVFNITKVGKIAGCYVTEGTVKRGAKVRLLRDDVVIHEGTLKTLRRFKEEVREVKDSFECGMAFENYDDIKVGDMIECFEIESIARVL